MKRFILLALALALLGGAGYAYSRFAPRKTSNVYANLPRETVQRGQFLVTIDEIGVLSAERRELIRPGFRGRISKLADDGSWVEKGQPVAWLDTELVVERLEEEITSLRGIKANLERNVEDIRMGLEGDFLDLQSAAAVLEFDQAKLSDVNRDLMTLEALSESKLATESDLDKTKMQVESGKLDAVTSDLDYQQQYANHDAQKTIKSLALQQLVHRRDKAMNAIGEEQNKLNLAVIPAPISGIFLIEQVWGWDRHHNDPVAVGSVLHEHSTIGSIPDLSSIVINTQVSESAVMLVKPGSKANVTLDAFPDLQITGQVANVGLIAIERERSAAGSLTDTTETSGLKVFEVAIRPDTIDQRLRPNMTANVSIIVSQKDDVVFAPLRCVFNKGGQKTAYVATATGYEARSIVLGQRNRSSVIIRKGLEPAEQVFTLDLEPSNNVGQANATPEAGSSAETGGSGSSGSGGGAVVMPGGGGPDGGDRGRGPGGGDRGSGGGDRERGGGDRGPDGGGDRGSSVAKSFAGRGGGGGGGGRR